MAKAKHRYYAKWRITALTVGFFTIMFAAPVLAQCSGYIYWVDNDPASHASSTIHRADCRGGTIIEDLIAGTRIRGIALDLTNGHIYWIEYGAPGQIGRADLDGNNIILNLVPGVNRGVGIALDVTNGHIYWAEQDATEKIRRADLDGGNDLDIPNTTGLGRLYTSISLDLTNGHIYWGQNYGPVNRIDLNGDGHVQIMNGVTDSHRYALDLINKDIYWAEKDNNIILRTDKDIIDIQTVDIIGGSIHLGTSRDVALDLLNNHIYWVEYDQDNVGAAIRRANLNVTDPVNLITIPGV